MDPAAFAALGEELLSYPSELEAVAALDLPVTVIVGEDDVGLRSGADQLAAAIPGAHLEVIPGAGHSPQEDAPQLWLDALGRHFERVEIAGAG